jgi:hypothetical protein
MALDDLISLELTSAEEGEIMHAIEIIFNIINPKAKNLTPAERQMYGKVRYEFEVWIDKCRGYMRDNPTLVPPYIDIAEFERDYAARNTMKPIEQKLQQLFEMFDDSFVLLGHDLYINCIAFYNALKVASKNNVPGSTVIFQDLKQQFPGVGKKKEDPAVPPTT